MLEAAGIAPELEAVYRLLVTAGGATAEDIARRTDLDGTDSTQVLEALVRQGLATHTDGTPRMFRAVPPDIALLPRIKHTADALDTARAEAGRLLETYRETARRHDAGQLLEVITGAEALRQRLKQIQVNAREEMLWFCRAQYVAMPSGSNSEEFEALARGVRYRVLYEKAFFDDEGAIDNVAAGVRAGEVARSVPWLPLRLAIADRSVGIFPLVPGGPHGSPGEPTTALVRDSSLLDALVALFESYWENAVPLHLSAEGDDLSPDDSMPHHPALSPADSKLLSLLVAGVADKAIASQLGLSRRTVQRRIQSLMTRAGAGTRMQLAWQAARRGWL
ncbi:TrmB family transcriptional regulator [Streptomyces sp. Act143]|uniref:helix-turn-helix transcriptional regulator n=1 Tax=Streptomyces sp. Act143 TaxID=2200760 RepID=UPI000D675303|nr:LuxR family transcriptional regulator [Streptomyces sp. Act143]PWI15283.1 TrmB family transcriptional regulator [Streptomyces sp. Act143]